MCLPVGLRHLALWHLYDWNAQTIDYTQALRMMPGAMARDETNSRSDNLV